MVSHRFLAEDFSVEETVFGTGDRIWVNFGTQPFTFEGKTIAPLNYLINA